MHELVMLVARWIVIVDDIISASIGQTNASSNSTMASLLGDGHK